jgi:c-di-GMP-binding flagellar brake protein YcgR
MIRSVNARAKHSLQFHGGSNIDEDKQTVSLTDRGRENAEYLVRREYRSARFSNIDDTDSQRLIIFRYRHRREPRKGNIDNSGITSHYTVGS